MFWTSLVQEPCLAFESGTRTRDWKNFTRGIFRVLIVENEKASVFRRVPAAGEVLIALGAVPSGDQGKVLHVDKIH